MILITYGTRPEYIKIKPLINEMLKQNVPFKTLFTGQHKDLVIDKATYNVYMVNNTNNRLDNIINNCTMLPDEWFNDIKYILVQGDTTSVLGLSLSAFNRKIKVIHLEAGLRTYDNNNPYPEELNRSCISKIATIHFCPTSINYDNLKREHVFGNINIVGNTSIDAILPYKDKVTTGGGCLITLHRRENQSSMTQWLLALNQLAIKHHPMVFTFIAHPNFKIDNQQDIKNLYVITAVPHDKMLDLLVKTDIIISDSGGIQEESSFLHKPVIVCRKETERQEAIGTTSFMCSEPEYLPEVFEFVQSTKLKPFHEKCPFGDGHAAEKIVKILYD